MQRGATLWPQHVGRTESTQLPGFYLAKVHRCQSAGVTEDSQVEVDLRRSSDVLRRAGVHGRIGLFGHRQFQLSSSQQSPHATSVLRRRRDRLTILEPSDVRERNTMNWTVKDDDLALDDLDVLQLIRAVDVRRNCSTRVIEI